MGVVYSAEHVEIGKRVALKFLHAELTARPDVVARLVQEARAASAIAHPGIVDIHDIGTDPAGARYLVMELLEGESLRALLEREGPLPIQRAVGFVLPVLSALAAAHEKGIVHRDLKPENLFLDRTDGTQTVKLLDFGTAKMTEAVSRLTRTGAAWGTAHYMAPEQARGESDLDLRVDVYGAGVILYELLTGRVPFDGENYNAVMFRVVSESVTPPRTLRPDLPEDLEAVILRALEKERTRRWQCAEDMADALRPFADVPTVVPAKAALPPADPPRRETPQAPSAPVPAPAASAARTLQSVPGVRPRIRPIVAAAVGAAVLIAVASAWLLWGAISEPGVPAVAAPIAAPQTAHAAAATALPAPPPLGAPEPEPATVAVPARPAAVARTAAGESREDRSRARDSQPSRRRRRILTDTSEFDR